MGARVQTRVSASVATVTVGDGTRRNALQRADWIELARRFVTLGADPDVRCVVVRGRDGHFCAGSDLTTWADAEREEVHATFVAMEHALRAVETATVPVVAVVEGAAAGAGCQLALACDVRLLADGASLAMPTGRLGILPSDAFAARLVELVGPGRARELLYTGRTVTTAEAVHLGLAESHAVGDVDDALAALTAQLLACPPGVLAASKRAVAAALVPRRPGAAPTVLIEVMRAALTRYRRRPAS